MTAQVFDRMDANGDDFITPDEVAARSRPMLAAARRVCGEEFLKVAGGWVNRFGKKEPSPKKDEKKP